MKEGEYLMDGFHRICMSAGTSHGGGKMKKMFHRD